MGITAFNILLSMMALAFNACTPVTGIDADRRSTLLEGETEIQQEPDVRVRFDGRTYVVRHMPSSWSCTIVGGEPAYLNLTMELQSQQIYGGVDFNAVYLRLRDIPIDSMAHVIDVPPTVTNSPRAIQWSFLDAGGNIRVIYPIVSTGDGVGTFRCFWNRRTIHCKLTVDSVQLDWEMTLADAG